MSDDRKPPSRSEEVAAADATLNANAELRGALTILQESFEEMAKDYQYALDGLAQAQARIAVLEQEIDAIIRAYDARDLAATEDAIEAAKVRR